MKIFGDEKSKKRGIRIGAVAVILGIAVTVVTLAMHAKPFSGPLNPDKNMPDDQEPDTAGEAVDALPGDPEIKGLTVDDLAKYDADRKKDYYTILLAGTDNDGTRTDTIMVVSFDIKNKKVSLLSVPRDTLVNVTRTVKKINSGYAVGGIKELKKELKGLLGIEIDRYAVISIPGMVEFIDAMGGVDIDVKINMVYSDPTQDLEINIKKGFQHLDGQNAVNFARFRKTYKNGDIGRISAQQQLMTALAKKLISPATIPKIPGLVSILMENIESDFTVGEMISIAVAGLSVDYETIEMFTLPGYDETLKGQSYWVPYGTQLLKLINSNFNPTNKVIERLNLLDPATLRPAKTEPKADDKPATDNAQPETSGSGEQPAQPSGDLSAPDLFPPSNDTSEEDPIVVES